MDRSFKLAVLMIALMVTLTGCLGLFGGDDDGEGADDTSISSNVGNDTARELEARSAGQFRNFTVPGQDVLDRVVEHFNGTISGATGAAAVEDRNDRSGTNYNSEFIIHDIGSLLPEGQPAEIHAKLWYLPGPGASGDLDLYINVPGTHTEWAGDDCDEFSWKICVQEMVVSTVGIPGGPSELGVQAANMRAMQGMDYFLEVQVTYVENVVTPGVPYAFEMPENATGIVLKSEKAGGGEHIQAKLLVIDPDDELVEYVTYNDISLPTESKLVPISKPGEYIIYVLDIHGGFLSVEADVPVTKDVREARILEIREDSVTDASGPTPGAGQICIPSTTPGCIQNTTYQEGDSQGFAIDGTFPLEVHGFIGGGQSANVNAEVRITSDQGEVFRQSKIVKYEDDRGTIGSSRDELNTWTSWDNLSKGQYTISYVIDGNAEIGHTVVTYER